MSAYHLNYTGKFAEQRFKLMQRNKQCYIPNCTQRQYDSLLHRMGLIENVDYIKRKNIVSRKLSRVYIDGYYYEVIE